MNEKLYVVKVGNLYVSKYCNFFGNVELSSLETKMMIMQERLAKECAAKCCGELYELQLVKKNLTGSQIQE